MMFSRFDRLATYNTEVYRGVVHTPEYVEQMAALQVEHDTWLADSEAAVQRLGDAGVPISPGFSWRKPWRKP